MNVTRRRWWMGVSRCALCCVLLGCAATPLPTPPSADIASMSLVVAAGDPGAVDLSGDPGATEGTPRLRVTSQRAWREVDVAADGSFDVLTLPAGDPPVLYLEAITDDADVFLVAVTGDGSGPVTATSSGPDSDADGSPDAVDCAPTDPAEMGRRCADACGPVEICNGRDDDCNGLIDDGCTGDLDGDGDGFCASGRDLNTDGDCLDAGEAGGGVDCDDGNASVNSGVTEICDDGLDQDCDGVIDDDC